MHCDEKRTLYALKEEIQDMWDKLKEKEFEDKELLEKINSGILDYLEYKKYSG